MEPIHRGPMVGRTVLVTGGTAGIGRATALGLARMGAHLAICGRDRESTEGAAGEIRAAGGGQVEVFVADLSSQSQVRRLADEVLQRLSRIDVLVNNVGGYWNTRHVTADGLERTFALNHLAPFLLTNLLWDRLSNSAPARVVTVASNAHAQGESTSTTSRGSGPTPGHGPTASPSSPTSCSPMSWPGGCRPPPSPPTRCIPA
jgi:NAD(P)-dependent dehydrogenase (short-subunit alcohol dehydrogenase family)